MVYRNRTLICGDCMNVFTYTGEEQEAAACAGGVRAPSRCPQCRASKAALVAARADKLAAVPGPRR